MILRNFNVNKTNFRNSVLSLIIYKYHKYDQEY